MNKIKLTVLSIALIGAMTGCAGPSYRIEKGWVKKGVSQEQSRTQYFDCQEKAKANAERETQVGGLVENCMTLNGYKWGEYKTQIR